MGIISGKIGSIDIESDDEESRPSSSQILVVSSLGKVKSPMLEEILPK